MGRGLKSRRWAFLWRDRPMSAWFYTLLCCHMISWVDNSMDEQVYRWLLKSLVSLCYNTKIMQRAFSSIFVRSVRSQLCTYTTLPEHQLERRRVIQRQGFAPSLNVAVFEVNQCIRVLPWIYFRWLNWSGLCCNWKFWARMTKLSWLEHSCYNVYKSRLRSSYSLN